MKVRRTIGLSLDGPFLRIAILEYTREHLQLGALKTLEFKQPVMAQAFQEEVTSDTRSAVFVEEPESGDEEFSSPNGDFAIEGELPEDLFDLTESGEPEADPDTESDMKMMAEFLRDMDSKTLELGLALPPGSTIFHPVGNINYSDRKKREINKTVEEKIRTVYEPSESEVQYAYEIQDNGRMLLVSREGGIPVIDSLESAGNLADTKLTYREILPEEASVIGLIRANYHLGENQVTAIIQAGYDSSRIIILDGEQVLSVLPLIHRGQQTGDPTQTCLSKLILELDQDNIPWLHQIIVVNGPLREHHFTFISEHLPEVLIESFRFDEDQIAINPQHQEHIRQFIPAIGVAWANASKESKFPVLSLIPPHIQERQKVFKLKWHGILLLLLITILPVLFNTVYQQKMETYDRLSREALNAWQQVEMAKPLVAEAEALASSIAGMNNNLEMLDTLAAGGQRWSHTLSLVSEGFRQVNSCWIDKLVTMGDELIIEGYSRYRNRVPEIAGVFDEVEIKEITETTFRDVTLYKFILRVKRVVPDPSVYDPGSGDAL